jgi:hypothetical protein
MTTYTNPLNSQTKPKEISLVITKGGIIALDHEPRERFKWLHVGGGGNLVVEGLDGNPIPFYGILGGSWIPVAGKKVLTSGTVDTVTITTTATNITWHGVD